MKTIASLVLSVACVASTALAQPFMPEDHRALTKTVSYGEMETFLRSVDGEGPVTVSAEGKTTQGRSLYLVRLSRSTTPAWRILLFAQQHGDEISGKDALLYLIRDISRKPDLLPKDTEVWILPTMNPDGAEAGTRVNGAGADLNRDHMTLFQPETQALHRVVQRVRPDIAVDCHEFGRRGESWQKRGWEKWPDITMDRLNNPLFDKQRVAAAERWMTAAAEAEKKGGHPFLRYWVGGVPPQEEQRHSSPDVDSGMNAIGAYGGLSFIIEAAARSGAENIAKELGNRVDAYLVLLRRFVRGNGGRAQDREAIRAARAAAPPMFLPVNYLWVNSDATITQFPVTLLDGRRKLEVPTQNMMTDVVVKRSVATPAGYVIEKRAVAEYAALLQRHAIPFEQLQESRTIRTEACTLLRVEEDFDEVYSRYEGRQIVRCADASTREFEAGSLVVTLGAGNAIRAALLLEPSSLYGLYQYSAFRKLAAADGALPVLRIVR